MDGYKAAAALVIVTLAIVLCLFVCLTMIILIIKQCVVYGSPSLGGDERNRQDAGCETEAKGKKPNIVLALSNGQIVLGFLLAATAIGANLLGDESLSALCKDLFCALFGPAVTIETLKVLLNRKAGKEDERDDK